jgi:hypothetical protein
MNDRELLEAAAKAAGMTGMKWTGSGMAKLIDPSRPESTGSIGPTWNPLADDGDALRLMVTLRLNLNFEEFDGVEYACAVHCKSHQGYDDAIADDANASVRRAIVRAAAETSRAKGGSET